MRIAVTLLLAMFLTIFYFPASAHGATYNDPYIKINGEKYKWIYGNIDAHSNEQFMKYVKKYNFTGNGTSDDPFVIDHFYFGPYGIDVSNVSFSIEVSNCYFSIAENDWVNYSDLLPQEILEGIAIQTSGDVYIYNVHIPAIFNTNEDKNAKRNIFINANKIFVENTTVVGMSSSTLTSETLTLCGHEIYLAYNNFTLYGMVAINIYNGTDNYVKIKYNDFYKLDEIWISNFTGKPISIWVDYNYYAEFAKKNKDYNFDLIIDKPKSITVDNSTGMEVRWVSKDYVIDHHPLAVPYEKYLKERSESRGTEDIFTYVGMGIGVVAIIAVVAVIVWRKRNE